MIERLPILKMRNPSLHLPPSRLTHTTNPCHWPLLSLSTYIIHLTDLTITDQTPSLPPLSIHICVRGLSGSIEADAIQYTYHPYHAVFILTKRRDRGMMGVFDGFRRWMMGVFDGFRRWVMGCV